MGFRTVSVGVDGLVQLLTDLGSGHELRLCGHGIPKGAALGPVTYDPDTRRFDIELVHHNWPTEFPAGQPIFLQYARRHGHAGDERDWGAPQPIGPASA